MIAIITSITIKTIKCCTSLKFVVSNRIGCIRYILTFIIFFGIKYCLTDISGFSGANEGVWGVVSNPPHNNFITLSQSLFCSVKVGPDPALNLNCLMFLNGSEQSCTTKLCYRKFGLDSAVNPVLHRSEP